MSVTFDWVLQALCLLVIVTQKQDLRNLVMGRRNLAAEMERAVDHPLWFPKISFESAKQHVVGPEHLVTGLMKSLTGLYLRAWSRHEAG